MANLIYLTLDGDNQGLISSGCSSQPSIGNKAQTAHIDQIMIYEFMHGLNRDQNVNHHHLTIKKPIDKASPLLGKAICDNELLTCDFSFYRTNKFGINELYYKIKLTGAKISDIHVSISHIVVDNSVQPEESVSFSYESIIWEHCSAGTSAYSLWEDRLF